MRENPNLKKVGIYADDRGLFFPLDISESKWIQSNISISKKWTFRGLHHQRGAASQAKQVTVIKGKILDFVVDLRSGSFLDTQFFTMESGDQLYVPRGFAHGFLALEEDTMIQYLVDNRYEPNLEISFDWTSVNIVKELVLAEVGEISNLHLSSKDAVGVPLNEDFIELI